MYHKIKKIKHKELHKKVEQNILHKKKSIFEDILLRNLFYDEVIYYEYS